MKWSRGCCSSFRVTSETYQRLRSQQVLVLHNDEIGDLIWVENRGLEEDKKLSMT
ncbi:hypothetical protein [Pseudomonas putida]|uniref:hypothetical protein n=1 Tax=Pseudomonas putida TaxID=303 RepID=UPI0024E196BA|nr:hypothetical protein [Pseudomonas putida]HDS0978636.1 hypothetical protein [Pseudomonas putida]